MTVAGCDVGDPAALRDLLDSIPAEFPLTAVVHTAAVLDDAPVTGLTPERIERVLRVKAAGAWNLHELTRDADLSAFVMFSSLAGSVGLAGQGNYAPANAYLDALALHRRSLGLPALSVAWGPWAQGGMAEQEAVDDVRRRHGVPLIQPDHALLALDLALGRRDETVLVADIDWSRFAHASTATRPTRLFDGLPEARRALDGTDRSQDAADTLRERLAGLPPAERDRALLTVVRTQVAVVLGHRSAGAVEPGRPFQELGLDSVTAVELRNRLRVVTGLPLPATAVFDFPTVVDLAGRIGSELSGGQEPRGEPGAEELDRLETVVGTLGEGHPSRAGLAGRLRRLLIELDPGPDAAAREAVDQLSTASNDELFHYIEQEFGIS